MNLPEFLLARVAEDEALVDRHELDNGRKWMALEDADSLETKVVTYPPDPDIWVIALTDNLPTAEHVAAYHPARVMAECEAKRRIVQDHPPVDGAIEPTCRRCGLYGEADVDWPCLTLRALAAVYADHPDYQDDWRS